MTSLPLCVPADTGVHASAVSRGLLQNNAAASMIVHAADGTFLAGGNFVLTRCGRDGQNHTNKTMQLVTGRMARRAYGSIHRKRPVLGAQDGSGGRQRARTEGSEKRVRRLRLGAPRGPQCQAQAGAKLAPLNFAALAPPLPHPSPGTVSINPKQTASPPSLALACSVKCPRHLKATHQQAKS